VDTWSCLTDSNDTLDWWPSYEILQSIADAIADCKQLVDHSLWPFDCASGIDLADAAAAAAGVVEQVDDDADDVDDASVMVCQIPRHQMTACEMSVKSKESGKIN